MIIQQVNLNIKLVHLLRRILQKMVNTIGAMFQIIQKQKISKPTKQSAPLRLHLEKLYGMNMISIVLKYFMIQIMLFIMYLVKVNATMVHIVYLGHQKIKIYLLLVMTRKSHQIHQKVQMLIQKHHFHQKLHYHENILQIIIIIIILKVIMVHLRQQQITIIIIIIKKIITTLEIIF